MKLILAMTLLVASASAAILFDPKLDADWAAYKLQHSKQYLNQQEEVSRRGIWQRNLAVVAKHNAEHKEGKHSYDMKMNAFGDMTHREFLAKMTGFNKTNNMIRSTTGSKFIASSFLTLPDSVDWRTKGYVTPIKNQGQCGSCWAFSAVASLEGQHFAATGDLVSLSEQNLIDCSTKFGNQGCNGGLMDQAFDYIIANKGIDTEASYRYTAEDGQCKFKAAHVGATVTGYTDISSGDESSLTSAIASIGPISVAIDASNPSFQLYSTGIYNEPDCSTTILDHGVTAVGYGTSSAGDFYIVKNSWGDSWGMDGYIQMSRNNNNQCGIATSASYPLV